MESPFRDDREAAHMRAEQLAEENEQLRRELSIAKNSKRALPARTNRNGVLFAALASALSVFGVVAFGLASFFIARRPVHVDSSPLADGREHIDASWKTEHAPTTNALRAVAMIGAEAYAVGDGGTIVYRTPTGTWSSLASGTTVNLNAVGSALGVVYAVGDHGTILILSAQTRAWVPESSDTNENLHALGNFGGTVVAVGSGGTVVARGPNGVWKTSPTGTKEALYGVGFVRESELYAVGDKGTILKADPQLHWVAQETRTTEDFRAIVTLGDDLFAVGARGTVLRASSRSAPWAHEASEAQSDLNGAAVGQATYEVRAPGRSAIGVANAIFAVGRHGVCLIDNLHAKNGFEVSVLADGKDLFGVAASHTEGFAVGALGTIVHGVFEPHPNDAR